MYTCMHVCMYVYQEILTYIKSIHIPKTKAHYDQKRTKSHRLQIKAKEET